MPEHRPVNYVPDEICVVVSAPETADPGRFYDQLYEPVRSALNELIENDLERRGPETPKGDEHPLDLDLRPSVLIDGNRPKKVTLERLGHTIGGTGNNWVHLPPPPSPEAPQEEEKSKSLLFYRIVTEMAHGPETPAEDSDIVRELTLLLNTHAGEPLPPPEQAGKPYLLSAGPNWLCPASPNHSEGGPATLPVPVLLATATNKNFKSFHIDSQFGGFFPPDPERLAQIVVAVLDTQPDPAQVEKAKNKPHFDDWLKEVVKRVQLDNRLSYKEAHFDHLGPIVTGGPFVPNHHWDPKHPNGERWFDVADHGLFVASIIYAIVPGAEIRRYRVLNRLGIGDLQALAHVLSGLPSQFLTGESERRLLVNLSLTLDSPTGDARWHHWLPNSAKHRDRLGERSGEAERLLALTEQSIHDVLAWLTAQRPGRVLVVAAAGNDYRDQPVRPEPRAPARYDDPDVIVFGVAALESGLDRAANAAPYSNRGDVGEVANGIATYGGDAVPDPGGPGMPYKVDETDAVVGVFSADRLPDPSPNDPDKTRPNECGLAYWSGTSFATPIITGIAAAVWAAQPPQPDGWMTGLQVMNEIRNLAGSANSDLGVPTIEVKQG